MSHTCKKTQPGRASKEK